MDLPLYLPCGSLHALWRYECHLLWRAGFSLQSFVLSVKHVVSTFAGHTRFLVVQTFPIKSCTEISDYILSLSLFLQFFYIIWLHVLGINHASLSLKRHRLYECSFYKLQ